MTLVSRILLILIAATLLYLGLICGALIYKIGFLHGVSWNNQLIECRFVGEQGRVGAMSQDGAWFTP